MVPNITEMDYRTGSLIGPLMGSPEFSVRHTSMYMYRCFRIFSDAPTIGISSRIKAGAADHSETRSIDVSLIAFSCSLLLWVCFQLLPLYVCVCVGVEISLGFVMHCFVNFSLAISSPRMRDVVALPYVFMLIYVTVSS